MMKRTLFFFLLLSYALSFGQQTKIDSLKAIIKHESNQEKQA